MVSRFGTGILFLFVVILLASALGEASLSKRTKLDFAMTTTVVPSKVRSAPKKVPDVLVAFETLRKRLRTEQKVAYGAKAKLQQGAF